MPARLNRRQLREQEELRALDAPNQPDVSDEESEPEVEQLARTTGAGFGALMTPLDSDTDGDEETTARPSKNKKKKKNKKKTPGPASPVPAPALTPAPTPPGPQAAPSIDSLSPSAGPSKKERKALKKQKAKEKIADQDDLDKALAELSIKYPDLRQAVDSTNTTSATRSAFSALASLLSVSLQHLDAEAEMRKFFGAKAILAAKSSEAASSSTPRRTITQRSNLTRPQPTWWPAKHREGLSGRMLSDEECEMMRSRHQWEQLPGEKIWTVEYSNSYRGATKTFVDIVMSGDPSGFTHILKAMPYHADTLLQLSEVCYHREEYSTGSDYINRALFAYERAFVGSFNFTSGVYRLDFDRVENRPFFLALHRQASDLQRRGYVRSAFEFGRLLYSLEPWTDPHGALLHLDYLAIKAGMGQWLLDVWDFFATQAIDGKGLGGRLRPTVLPGWAYARSLALFMREEQSGDRDHTASSAALKDAILAFPSVVPLLADKADISMEPSVRSHSAFRVFTDRSMLLTNAATVLHLLSHLYAQRSFALWKLPERSAWFMQTVTTALPELAPSYDNTTAAYRDFHALFSKPELALSVYRHTIVLEASCRSLFRFIPSNVTQARQVACDPLPPITRVNQYDAEFFKGAEDTFGVRRKSRRAAERVLEQRVPDPVFRGQLQAFFAANRAFAQRFPGGLAEFAEWAGQMPDDALEDIMIAEVNRAAHGGEGMPGQMPGLEIDFGAVDEEVADDNNDQAGAPDRVDQNDGEQEDEEEDPDVAPLPVRVIRNIMNRFFGVPNAQAMETSSDEEDDQ